MGGRYRQHEGFPVITRRNLLLGILASGVAPAIVRVSSLMAISAIPVAAPTSIGVDVVGQIGWKAWVAARYVNDRWEIELLEKLPATPDIIMAGVE